jgi:hypothetical protein
MRLFLRSLLFTFFAITLTSVNVFSQSATITTDQADYPPGSTVIITGTGFRAGETVTLQVIHYNTIGDNDTSAAHQPFTTIADANGNVSSTWIVPLDQDELGATLLLTADGQSSKLHADWTFTDGQSQPQATIVSSSTNNTSTYGQSVTFTVSVKQGSNAVEEGNVNFFDGNTKLNVTSIDLNSSGQATYTTTSLSANPSLGHTIRVIYNATINYKSTNTFLVQKVNLAALLITADNQSKAYGAALPALTVSYTGLVNGDAAPKTLASISTTATASSPVVTGGYPITASGAADVNYTITYAPGTLTINPVALTITADNQSKAYGAALPTLTVSYTGLVNSDLAPKTVPSISTTALASSPVVTGGYPITATGAADVNYTITYAPGTLTINPVALLITADNQSKAYGAALPTLTVSYSGLVNGDAAPKTVPSISTTALASSPVVTGGYPITATGAADVNYTITYAPGTLSINPVALLITADNQSKAYGAALPTLTVSYSGLVNGDAAPKTVPSISTTALASSPVVTGGYPITASGAADVNYTITYAPGTLTIDPVALLITALNKSKYCGQTITFTGTEFTTTGLVNSDAVTSVTLNSDGAVSGASTSGSPYSIVPSGAIGVRLENYDISYKNGALTIVGITAVDASASSNTYSLSSSVKLSATISPAVDGVPVTFTLDPGTGVTTSYTATTIAGVASTSVSGLSVNLYKVTAVAGSGCATSNAAYLTVYDPNAGFVTGGGWINSPAGAYSADVTLTGKANFGFNAQYKKGSQTPDGNTEFQFQAGNLNFKSTNYATGSLVIAGAKAIFQGTGTINGTGSYNFMISAIDGSISGGGGVDKFRIKIQTAGGGVVYDNNVNASNNADPTTVLGGGSIVIHSTSNTKSRLMDTVSTKSNVSISNNQNSIGANDLEGNGKLSITVMPNPTSYYFTFIMKSLSKENVKLTVTDITGRVVEQRCSVPANSTLQLGSGYHPGIYIAEFIQGNDRIILRLIKEGK